MTDKEIKALENLIKGYKFEKMKNVLDEQSLKEALEDYIPKSKIREKIEELEESMNKARPFDLSYIEYCEDRIEVLQELMEDK